MYVHAYVHTYIHTYVHIHWEGCGGEEGGIKNFSKEGRTQERGDYLERGDIYSLRTMVINKKDSFYSLSLTIK